MDKKKSKYKDDYSLRTLAYYHREGGIYNEVITILQRIKAEKGNGRLLPPAKILNLASEAYDICVKNCTDQFGNIDTDGAWGACFTDIILRSNKESLLHEYNDHVREVVLETLCVLLTQDQAFYKKLIPQFEGWAVEILGDYYIYFKPLIHKLLENEQTETEILTKQLAAKDKIIAFKDSEIANLSSRNSELEKKVATLEPVFDAYVKNIVENSNFNQCLTLETILRWAKKRKHYKLADQVISMLKDLGRKIATDEELEKIESVEEELISKYTELSIVNNNMGIGSNILTGIAQNPMMPMGYDQNQIMQKFIEFISNGARR